MATRKPPKSKETPTGQTLHLHVNGAPGAPEDDDQFEELDAQEDGALSRTIEELKAGGSVKVDVYRILPVERAGWCRSYSILAFSIDKLAKDFGAGAYRVKFKDQHERFVKGGTQRIDIAEPVGSHETSPSSIQDIVAIFKEERERERIDREKRKGEWWELGKLLLPIVAPKILDMFGGSRNNLADMIRAVKDLKDLQAPTPDLGAQFNQVVGILQGAKELVGDNTAQTGSTWVDLVRDVLQSPAVGAIASGLIPQPGGVPGMSVCAVPPRATTPPAVPKATKQVASCVGASPKVDPMLEQLNWLKSVVTDLLMQASRHSSPRIYAEVVLDNLPEFVTPRDLLERLSNPGWLAQLTLLEPRVGEHQQWFTKFRDYALKALLRRERRAAEATMTTNVNNEADGGSGGAPPDPAGLNQPRPDVEEQQNE